jgi:hypothetical protein
MAEVWLRANRRAVLMGMLVPVGVGLVGLVLASGAISLFAFVWLRIVGAIVLALAVIVLFAMFQQLLRPRLAYQDGKLLLYLSLGPPISVPLEHVECFLLGQGPAFLPYTAAERAEVSTVVVRLEEKATDYARRDVKPALGAWCDSHVTIRGTWCEPLDESVVRRLNRRLAEVNRERAVAS